jgi:hypothetical protein
MKQLHEELEAPVEGISRKTAQNTDDHPHNDQKETVVQPEKGPEGWLDP